MTTSEFATELRQLLRRARLLRQAEAGKVKLIKVIVRRKKMRWVVQAKHRTYVRKIAPPGWKAT